MRHRILVTPGAQRQIRELDPAAARPIRKFLTERLPALDDPRQLGTALVSSTLWRYRVGEYRIICDIRESDLIVLVVEIGHRREVYRRR